MTVETSSSSSFAICRIHHSEAAIWLQVMPSHLGYLQTRASLSTSYVIYTLIRLHSNSICRRNSDQRLTLISPSTHTNFVSLAAIVILCPLAPAMRRRSPISSFQPYDNGPQSHSCRKMRLYRPRLPSLSRLTITCTVRRNLFHKQCRNEMGCLGGCVREHRPNLRSQPIRRLHLNGAEIEVIGSNVGPRFV
jgi:hypothetical protein